MTSPTSAHEPNSSLASPHFLGITALIEAQVDAAPGVIALSWDGRHLDYGELNARANRLAAHLRACGAAPGALVGIFLDRSFDLLIGILAILKTGAAYLPLDLACPEDRLAFILSDAGAHLVVTESSLRPRLAGFPEKIICLDLDTETIAAHPAENLPAVTQPHQVAYVIYTSGSTGRPKGCRVTHENVTRLFSATDDLFHFSAQDVWTLFFSCAFDFSVWEIFGPLFYGGRLVIVPQMVSRSAEALRELVLRERVTVLNQTPSAFRQFIQADQLAVPAKTWLRYVIFGGEMLEVQHLQPWFERHGAAQPQCVNMYGITETTVHVTFHAVTLEDLTQPGSNIGRPMSDLEIYLVDEQLQPVAPGETGEMLVGGPGVALGYLNRPDLTQARFIENPFVPGSTSKLYRSGDLARRREDGDLEYLGRIDHQVKIRGYRVELPEIESILARHPAMRECAVLARGEPGEEPRLVAYLILREGRAVEIEELRAHVAHALPEYMVPAAYVFLSAFPLTLNGKLDRAALPLPGHARPHLASAFVAPQNEIEQTVARLWKEVLRRDTVGIDDNFFDLGGDSLLITSLHRLLQTGLKREIPITDLFAYPTIRRLTEHLGAHDTTGTEAERAAARAKLQRASLNRLRRGAVTQPLVP